MRPFPAFPQGSTRVRATQIMKMLCLAPRSQILFVPSTRLTERRSPADKRSSSGWVGVGGDISKSNLLYDRLLSALMAAPSADAC